MHRPQCRILFRRVAVLGCHYLCKAILLTAKIRYQANNCFCSALCAQMTPIHDRVLIRPVEEEAVGWPKASGLGSGGEERGGGGRCATTEEARLCEHKSVSCCSQHVGNAHSPGRGLRLTRI